MLNSAKLRLATQGMVMFEAKCISRSNPRAPYAWFTHESKLRLCEPLNGKAELRTTHLNQSDLHQVPVLEGGGSVNSKFSTADRCVGFTI